LASGVVASLARPGANLTGTTRMISEMSAKHVELLKEAVPSLARLAVLWNPTNSSHRPALQAVDAVARSLSLQIHPLEVRAAADLDSVFAAIIGERADGVLFIADPIFFIQLRRMADFVISSRLPAIANFTEFPKLGGFMGYAPSLPDEFRHAAGHIDKIPEGSEASGFTRRAADAISTGDQPQSREGARSRSTSDVARACRRGDRMKLPRRKFLHLAAGAAALPFAPHVARAQAYPTRPVRIVVGFAPGGGADINARLIGQWLSERLGQQFVIENRPGASGNIATEAVVRAPPDGYTLLVTPSSAAINATLYNKLSFNFIHDIAPVAGVFRGP